MICHGRMALARDIDLYTGIYLCYRILETLNINVNLIQWVL